MAAPDLREPTANGWAEVALQFFFYCLTGVFTIMMAQLIWALISLGWLYI
jgi:hypothetical protein